MNIKRPLSKRACVVLDAVGGKLAGFSKTSFIRHMFETEVVEQISIDMRYCCVEVVRFFYQHSRVGEDTFKKVSKDTGTILLLKIQIA